MALDGFELREYPVSLDAQRSIAEGVFGARPDFFEHLRPYFRYYNRQCRQITSIAMMDGTAFPVSNSAELLDIITEIRARAAHREIATKLIDKHNGIIPDGVIQNTIDLALRLLLMIDVGVFSNAYSGRECVTWTTGTIDDFIRRMPLFDGVPVFPCDGVKIEKFFNACNLERIAGVEVQLTANLNDHLVFREDINAVSVFHHASFLQSHQG